jgi:hypothetical protein
VKVDPSPTEWIHYENSRRFNSAAWIAATRAAMTGWGGRAVLKHRRL